MNNLFKDLTEDLGFFEYYHLLGYYWINFATVLAFFFLLYVASLTYNCVRLCIENKRVSSILQEKLRRERIQSFFIPYTINQQEIEPSSQDSRQQQQ